MLAYPIDEAENMLQSKLTGAEQSLENVEEDLDFLREQITVRETSVMLKNMRLTIPDTGSCCCASVQLGRYNEEKGEGRRW